MAREAPNPASDVVDHSSIFLLPMSLRRRDQRAVPSVAELKAASEALCAGLPRHGWSLVERKPHEATYFHRHVRDVIKERFLQKEGQDPGAQDQPTRVQLYLFDVGVAVLALHFRGVRPYRDLLAFHDKTRYLAPIYPQQELPPELHGPAGTGPEWIWKNKLVYDLLKPAFDICETRGFCLEAPERGPSTASPRDAAAAGAQPHRSRHAGGSP